MASSVLEIVAVGSNGTRQTMRVTAEHPIHLEEWNDKPRGSVLAALENEAAIVNGGGAGVTNAVSDGGAKISPATLFPSDQKTAYGDWVKAGAIKKGDRLSTFGSVYALKNNGPTIKAAQKLTAGNDNQQAGAAQIDGQIRESELTTLGLLKAANDNTPLTVEKVTTNPTPTRVYNLEITSKSGQITHNYMVGEEMVWGHNAVYSWSKPLGRLVRQLWGEKCIYCGNPADTIDHIEPRCDGGTNDIENLVPACRRCNSSKGGRPLREWWNRVRGNLNR